VIGHTISHYHVTAKLGQGGMGEVYRAMDTKLGREVAIKLLPDSFAADGERVARFEREAKVLASLDHPNIGSIYGMEDADGKRCLVLQLIEGETLASRLKRGALPVEEALELCCKIAEALEAAHEKGITHRDLKPGNLMVTDDGNVKVLDFGLAKTREPRRAGDSSADSRAPTLTSEGTLPGTLLGTAAYMSPEQARGKPLDKRSDVWSFGCIVFECLTGTRPFKGKDVGETLAAILKDEPDWGRLPLDTPPQVRWLLRKCLAKNLKGRLRSIGDAQLDLEARSTASDYSHRGAVASLSARTATLATLGVAVILVLVAFIVAKTVRREAAAQSPMLVEQILRATNGLNVSRGNALALSPDGTKLVYAVDQPGAHLRLLSFSTGEDQVLKGTESGHDPFFSPNGQSIGFVTDNELKTVSLSGGSPRVLVKSFLEGGRGASWGAGRIVYSVGSSGGLQALDLASGRTDILTQLLPGESTHRWPQILPGGEHVIFMSDGYRGFSQATLHRLELLELASGKRHTLKDGCLYGRYVSSGHLLYVVDGALYAQRLDLGELKLTGSPQLIRHGIRINQFEVAHYAISQSGTLAYLTADQSSSSNDRTLLWLTRDGNTRPASNARDMFTSIDLSPDDQQVVGARNTSIRILDLATDTMRVFTLRNTTNSFPVWTADNESILFGSNRNGQWGIWRKQANAISSAEHLFGSSAQMLAPVSVTRDGQVISGGTLHHDTLWDAWVHDISEHNSSNNLAFTTAGNENWPVLSPDGNWLAFSHDGQLTVVLRGNRLGKATLTSGTNVGRVRLSADGEDIYYEAGHEIWVVPVQVVGEAIRPGAPEKVVTLPAGVVHAEWDLTSDEQQFLVLVEGKNDSDVGGQVGFHSVRLVFNWTEQLRDPNNPGS
jgi:serine/threonine-protein kinase